MNCSIFKIICTLAFAALIASSCSNKELNPDDNGKQDDNGKNPSYNYSFPVPEAIDLGLSVKWASFNLGASKPEEFGDYFAWGEVLPYYEPGYAQADSVVWRKHMSDGYYWSSYKWCNNWNVSPEKLTKYNTLPSNGIVDNKTVLDLEDDAAYVNLGEHWRIPTKQQWLELILYCTYTSDCVNGVNGYRFTSKKDGYTDKSIFFPLAGNRSGKRLYHIHDTYVYYGASAINEKFPGHAWRCLMNSMEASVGDHTRTIGIPIRPVFTK